ncbi:Importin-beta N-terminal domain [Trinorchestia longiramus]|nr:Importin-beta N-terminal domain [Trinorchestia longiramus]
MSENVCSLLKKLLLPDTEAVKQGTTELNALLQQDNGVSELCQVLANTALEAGLRQCAATMLRRYLMVNKNWKKLTPNTLAELKNGLVNILGNEADSSVRTAIAMLMGLITRNTEWPELMQLFFTLGASEDLAQKQLCLYVLSVVSGEGTVSLLPHCSVLLQLLDRCLTDSKLPSVSVGHAIVTIARLSELVNSQHAGQFQGIVRNVISVSHRLLAEDEQPVWEAIELLEVLIENEIPVLAADLPATVQFIMGLSSNLELTDGLRIKAITFLGLVVRCKKKYLVKHKLTTPIVLALFSILCEDVPEDHPLGILMSENPEVAFNSTGEDEVIHSAAQSLDQCARHLAPDRLLQPLMPVVEQALQSGDVNKIKGGYLALAMITDGCSDRLRTKHLDSLLKCVTAGVASSSQLVQDCALLALSQFAEFLQPDISRHHGELLPLTLNHLTEVCKRSQNGCPDPPGATRMFYAVEVFCEHMDQAELLPHVEPLLQQVMAILQVEHTSPYMKKNAISVIGSVALSVKEHMAVHFEKVVALLKTYLLADSEGGESTPMQLQSLETLAQLTRSLGSQHIQPYANDIIDLTMVLIQRAKEKDDPELRKTCYRVFAALASVLHEKLAPHLPPVVESIQSSLRSRQGVVPVLKNDSNEAVLRRLGELEYSEGEEEEDLDVAGYSVENIFLEEKEDTCVALRELAESCGEGFAPFIPSIAQDVFELAAYPNEDVRQAALVTMTHFVIALSKRSSEDGIKSFEVWCERVMSKLSEAVINDDYSVVTAALEGYTELLGGVGERLLLHPQHLPSIMASITRVFTGKTKCQSGGDDDGDEDDASMDEAEMDEMLVEYAGDVLDPLGKVLGPAVFAQHFPAILHLFAKRLRPGSSVCVRSYVVGKLAECVEILGPHCAPFIPHLMPIFMGGARDPSSGEVRGNGIYGLGLLGFHGGELVLPHLPVVLMCLSEVMTVEKEPQASDNICGALARIIAAHGKSVPIPNVLPAVLNCLPLREDFEENLTVFSTFSALYQQREPTVLLHLPMVMRAAAIVYTTPQADAACQAVIEDLIRRVKADQPDQLTAMIAAVPEPELRDRLHRAANSVPPAAAQPPAAAGGNQQH